MLAYSGRAAFSMHRSMVVTIELTAIGRKETAKMRMYRTASAFVISSWV